MLDVDSLSVSFYTRNGKTEAVRDVGFSLQRGTTIGIVGESGSGKSITCYSLLGLVPCPPGKIESGTATFSDMDLLRADTKSLCNIRGNRISIIFQDPMTSLNPFISVGAQIIEALRLHRNMSRAEARERAVQAMEEVGISEAKYRVDSYPHEFSGGMRQRVMIAMALATEPDVLIADEPTTALDVTIQAQILDLLQRIQQQRKLAIIFISHDLAVVRQIADEVLVMRLGEVVEKGTPSELFANAQHWYTQKLIAAIPTTAKEEPFSDQSAICVQVRNLSTQFSLKSGWLNNKKKVVHAVNDVSLDIFRGEILGLVGESGSGKSTLGRTITRLVDANSGDVLFGAIELLKLDSKSLKFYRKDFQMIFQDPYASLNPRMTVYETLREPIALHSRSRLSRSEIDARINTLMDDVGLERSAVRKYPHEFSGGQRQRIAIARAIATEPKFIVADEPVSALDVTIQAQILDLLLRLNKERHLTMLFISHDLSVVRYLCDRVAVMYNGEIIELDQTENVFGNPQQDYTKKLLAAKL